MDLNGLRFSKKVLNKGNCNAFLLLFLLHFVLQMTHQMYKHCLALLLFLTYYCLSCENSFVSEVSTTKMHITKNMIFLREKNLIWDK